MTNIDFNHRQSLRYIALSTLAISFPDFVSWIAPTQESQTGLEWRFSDYNHCRWWPITGKNRNFPISCWARQNRVEPWVNFETLDYTEQGKIPLNTMQRIRISMPTQQWVEEWVGKCAAAGKAEWWHCFHLIHLHGQEFQILSRNKAMLTTLMLQSEMDSSIPCWSCQEKQSESSNPL